MAATASSTNVLHSTNSGRSHIQDSIQADTLNDLDGPLDALPSSPIVSGSEQPTILDQSNQLDDDRQCASAGSSRTNSPVGKVQEQASLVTANLTATAPEASTSDSTVDANSNSSSEETGSSQPPQPQSQPQPQSNTSTQSTATASTTAAEAAESNARVKEGRKMFICTGFGDCQMSFSRSEHLARHIRKHTGERPFKCHCNRDFSRLDNLRQHAQTVHADKPDLNAQMMSRLVQVHSEISSQTSARKKKLSSRSHTTPVLPPRQEFVNKSNVPFSNSGPIPVSQRTVFSTTLAHTPMVTAAPSATSGHYRSASEPFIMSKDAHQGLALDFFGYDDPYAPQPHLQPHQQIHPSHTQQSSYSLYTSPRQEGRQTGPRTSQAPPSVLLPSPVPLPMSSAQPYPYHGDGQRGAMSDPRQTPYYDYTGSPLPSVLAPFPTTLSMSAPPRDAYEHYTPQTSATHHGYADTRDDRSSTSAPGLVYSVSADQASSSSGNHSPPTPPNRPMSVQPTHTSRVKGFMDDYDLSLPSGSVLDSLGSVALPVSTSSHTPYFQFAPSSSMHHVSLVERDDRSPLVNFMPRLGSPNAAVAHMQQVRSQANTPVYASPNPALVAHMQQSRSNASTPGYAVPNHASMVAHMQQTRSNAVAPVYASPNPSLVAQLQQVRSNTNTPVYAHSHSPTLIESPHLGTSLDSPRPMPIQMHHVPAAFEGYATTLSPMHPTSHLVSVSGASHGVKRGPQEMEGAYLEFGSVKRQMLSAV